MACPSQFEGTTECGRTLYIRYRFGYLQAHVSANPSDDMWDAIDGWELYGEQVDEEFDGLMTMDEMKNYLKDCLEFSESP